MESHSRSWLSRTNQDTTSEQEGPVGKHATVGAEMQEGTAARSGPVDGIRSRKWKPDARVKLIEVLVTVGLRELVWI